MNILRNCPVAMAWKAVLVMIMLNAIVVKSKGTEIRDTTGEYCKVTIDTRHEEGIVSPLIMGFNIAYCYAPDVYWQRGSGKIPQLLRQLGTGILRYPGGTIVTFFHWQHPTGQGWKDIQDPSFDTTRNEPPAAFMDMDEYLDVCSRLNTTPLIGINMGSGKKYNKVKEGIQEAEQLLLHCLQKGIRAKYFYLDNEPYQPDANYTFTAEEYADMVNQYVPAMKKIDDQIRIIVNPHPNHLDYTTTLIRKAGKNIDYLDIHYYWKWGHATFANWKSETVMRQGNKLPFREQRSFYRKLADSLGYPHIDLISLEWNIGHIGKGNAMPSQAEAALMAAEEFTQFIQSGMPIATFWPLSWPGSGDAGVRSLLDARKEYDPRKVYGMFALYKDILGRDKISSGSSDPAVQVLGVKSNNSDTLWVYLINKKPGMPFYKISLKAADFRDAQYKAESFDATENSSGPLKTTALNMENDGSGNFTLLLPEYSLTKITLIRKKKR